MSQQKTTITYALHKNSDKLLEGVSVREYNRARTHYKATLPQREIFDVIRAVILNLE
jgi:hypothetical protein